MPNICIYILDEKRVYAKEKWIFSESDDSEVIYEGLENDSLSVSRADIL